MLFLEVEWAQKKNKYKPFPSSLEEDLPAHMRAEKEKDL